VLDLASAARFDGSTLRFDVRHRAELGTVNLAEVALGHIRATRPRVVVLDFDGVVHIDEHEVAQIVALARLLQRLAMPAAAMCVAASVARCLADARVDEIVAIVDERLWDIETTTLID
jgi:anti-anti-sigma regulatory factor